jgi:hypothetical protein
MGSASVVRPPADDRGIREENSSREDDMATSWRFTASALLVLAPTAGALAQQSGVPTLSVEPHRTFWSATPA